MKKLLKISFFFCNLIPMLSLGQVFNQTTIAPFNNPKFFSSVIDYNNDGLDDVIGTNGNGVFQLWKNNGNSTFSDVTSQTGFPTRGGYVCGDIDKNGFIDIYRIDGDTVNFYFNSSNGFSNSCTSFYLSSLFNTANVNITWPVKMFDYNNDGIYDLIGVIKNGSTSTIVGKKGKLTCETCRFGFDNSPVQNLISIQNSIETQYQFADVNNDGAFDLLVGNGTQTSPYSPGYYNFNYYIYTNNGTGTFSLATNTGYNLGRSSAFGSLGEFNNDGLTDIFSGVADCCVGGAGGSSNLNPLYTFFSNGPTNYTSSTTAMTRATDRKYYQGATVVDLNLDKMQDIVWTNIYTYAFGSSALQCYINNGNNTFSESASSLGINLGTSPSAVLHTSMASTMLDLNNDLKPDLNIQSFGTYDGVFYNNYSLLNTTTNKSVKIKLNGCSSLKEGWGARIRYKSGGTWANTQHNAYASSGYPFIYLGIGSSTSIDSLIVTWTSGEVTTSTDLLSGNYYVINESANCINNRVGTTSSTQSLTTCSDYIWNGITYNQSGTYSWIGTNVAGCDSTATLNLTITPFNPNVFAQDTIRACGTSYNLDAGSGFSSYSWNTGATSQSINVTSTGSYKCKVNNGDCIGVDSVFVSIVDANIVNNDTAICNGTTITLNSNSVTSATSQSVLYDFNNCNLNEFTAQLTEGNLVGSASPTNQGLSGCGVNLIRPATLSTLRQDFGFGTYEVDAKAGDGVANQYFVVMNLITLDCRPSGTDDVGYGFYFNGVRISSATGTNPVTYPNWYHMKIRITPDSLLLWLNSTLVYQGTYQTPLANPFGPMSISTYSSSFYDNLKFTPYNNSGNNLWSTGETTPSITVSPTQTTTYYATVSNGISSCTDSVTVYVSQPSTSTTDISSCSNYYWNDIEYTNSGVYTFNATNAAGCDSIATLNFTLTSFNPNVFNQDTIRACGTSYSLDAGSGYSSYSWSTGATTQSINVSSTGWYNCTVNNGTCTGVDSVFVSIVDANIVNGDTAICQGASVTLNALSTCSGIQSQSLNWELLIPGNSYVGGETNFNQAGFDQSNRILYSVLKNGSINRVYAFDLVNKTVSSLTSNNAPGELYAYAFDNNNNRIVSSRVGRDVVYSLPINGGTWQQIGSGGFDAESYGSNSFWNPISSRFGYFGGYGFFSTKNWIWENNGSGWLNTYANNNNCNLARRVGNQLAKNKNGTKYYVFSGQGSCDGNQFASSCSLGSPWPTDVGVYCWLRDIWELDLSTYQFTNILPPNNQSILREGSFSYDYSKNTFYIIGGNAPTSTYGVYTPYSMEVLKYNRNTDAGFSAVSTIGTAPSSTSTGASIYDSIGNRIIYARADGIWALNLGSTCANTYLWSNSAASTSTDVSPVETTKYYATVSNGISSCRDSVTIYVSQLSISTTEISSCSNYSWNGIEYTNSGVYTFNTTNTAGCDSIATLNLTINNVSTSTTDISSCSNYAWNGLEYTNSGVYTFNTTNSAGCDSVATLNLTINNVSTSTTDISSCSNYAWNGLEYTNSGVYTFNTINSAGCDSIATLNLTIKNASTSTIDISSCSNYAWNGVEYTNSGVYTFNTTNAAGCDSVATLNLTIKNASTSTTEISSCSNYAWNGVEYTNSGVYTFNTTNAAGCDSVATLNLTLISFNPNVFAQDTIRACGTSYSLDAGSGYSSYSWSTGASLQSINVTSTGWYKCSINNGDCTGVDSVFVSIVDANIVNGDTAICSNSVVSLKAVNNSNTEVSNNRTIPGFIYSGTFNGHEYYKSTSQLLWNQAQSNCLLNNGHLVTIGSEAENNFVQSIITEYTIIGATDANTEGQWSWVDGTPFSYTHWSGGEPNNSTDGCRPIGEDYAKMYTNGYWNDDLEYYCGAVRPETYILEIDNPNQAISSNYYWSTGETTSSITVTPTQTTTYYTTVSNGISSCVDSVTVYVSQPTTSTTEISSCNNYSWNGIEYTNSGVYTFNTTNAAGCDSVATLNLTIKNASTSTTEISSCSNYAWNGFDYTNSGVYTFNTTNAAGCDSTATLNLTITSFNPNVFAQDTIRTCGNSYSLDAGSGYSSYSWGTGASSQSINVTSTGWYKCTVNNGTCEGVDSVFVSIVDANIVNGDTTICRGASVLLSNLTANHADLSKMIFLGVKEGHYYYLYDSLVNWEFANQIAQNKSGYLYIMNSIEEHHFIYSKVPYKGVDGINYWLGLRQLRTGVDFSEPGGGWYWVDGTPLTINMWENGEPNNAIISSCAGQGEDYAQFEWDDDGMRWNDAPLCPAFGFYQLEISYPIIEFDNNPEVMSHDFLWSTGETTPSITISPIQTTTYYNTVSNGINSCTDSVTVTVNYFNPNVFAQDTIRACGTSYSLDAGSGYSSYSWNTGATTQSINVTSTGWYNCTVNNGTCEGVDSVFVSIVNANIVNGDTAICKANSITINTNTDWSQESNIDVFINNHPDLNMFKQIDQHYYFLGNQAISWEAANQYARQKGMYLYIINSQAEEQSVYNSLPWKGDDGKQYWLGLYQDLNDPNYVEPNGGWKWVDGTSLTYSNWYSGEPNNAGGGENYAQIEWSYTGIKWNDAGYPAQNNTQLSYPIYELDRASLYNLNWSTGETTSSISVSPTQTTTYYATISNGISSCTDSVTVYVSQPSTSTAGISSCNSYIWNGQTYTQSGTYTWNGTNVANCDSTATLNLTINQSGTATLDVTAVDFYQWHGQTINTSGIYVFDTLTVGGCDSTITLNLTIQPSITDCEIHASDSSICAGQAVMLTSGQLSNVEGCSSSSMPSSLQQNLVAWYPFCGNATDETSNNYDGTIRGAQLCEDRFGNPLSAFKFIENQDIIVPNTSGLNLYPYSVSLWYSIDTIMGIYDEANIFSKYSPSAWNGYAIITANMGPEEGVSYYPVVKSWYLKSFNDRLIGRYGTAPFEHANVNMNQWYNMVFTVSNDSGKIYVNGNLVSKDKWDGDSGPSSNGYLWKIGGLYDRWFHGKIDDIAVYNKTLSAQEVNQLYNYQAAGVSQHKSYLWSNGQTTQQISVSPSVTTTYYCTVSNGYSNCTDSVTVYVSQPSSSTTEISSCSNYAWNGVEYTNSGIYTFNTTNAAGCDSVATLNLTINQLNTNLFTEDTIRTCGTSYSLIAEAGFNSYLWNNGETTQSIVVGSTGLYTCTVSNGTCSKTDSVFVSIVHANILNNDTTICNGNQVTLNSFVQSAPSSNLIFSPGSNYEYSFPPISDNWNLNIGGWATGNAPFGNVSDGAYGTYDFNYATFWPADGDDGDDLFVRRKINFTGYDLSSINYQLGVDNGYKLYVNGHLIASVNEEGYTYRWEYSGQIPAAYLNQGDNIIAVALEDHGGLTAFDMQITGNPTTTTNSILWSNGESTPSITVSPNQTTTYYCTISNGYSNCTDSVTVYVNQSSTSVSTVSSCDNYIWNNNNYTQSGVYTYTTINAVGCDSVATLNLTITPSTSNTTTASSCDSYTWSVNGQAYTQSGTYSSVNGCNTEILNLTITPSTSNTTTASSCDNYTWAVNGQAYTQSGSYTSVTGCNTEVLNLTITASTSNTITASSCDSYTWAVNGQAYTQSGTYSSVTGCNTEILNLTITPSTSNTTTASSCDSYTWSVNGQAYTQSGSYTSVTGCNTEVLNLTITASTSNTITASSCDSYTWSVSGQVYTQSGTYTSVTGCNTEVLNLTITPSTSNTTTASSCDSYTWSVNGQAYTQSGSYTSVTGCNTEVLNLTITASTSNTITASSCDSYTWSVNGQVYTQSGTYTSVIGCNTKVLNLTITPRTSNITNASSCSSYHWVANSQTYTTSGNYTFVNGCNTKYLNLTIKTNSVAASAAIASSTSITSGASVRLSISGGSLGTSASWKWYSASCGGSLVGTGASIFVSPTSTTTYYVRAVGTCNTTTCASVTVKVQAPCGPTAVVSNVSNNTICSSRSVVLSVQGTLGAGASWKWYKNGCGNGSSIGSGSTLTVSVNATTTYYVRSMGGSCGTTSCKSITITKASTPSTPETITGTTSGVCNAAGVRYSIAAVSGATSYVWTVPAGASIVNGQGTTSITVNYGFSLGINSSCGSSSVCVKAVNTCGSSDAKCLSVSNLPNFVCKTITGPSTACVNIMTNYSCAVVNGATNYTWVLPTGWTIVSGRGTNSIVVKPGSCQGTIKVTPSNACGSGSSISKYVKSSRCTSPTYSKNEVEIIPESIKDVSVWPNPANSYINLNDGGLKANKIEIIDAAGRLVMTTNWKTRLELGRIRTGIYILKIHTDEGVKVKRVEVQRL